MSRNMVAGRAKLTVEEQATILEQAIEGPLDEALDRAFREQLRLAKQKIAKTRQQRREKGRDR